MHTCTHPRIHTFSKGYSCVPLCNSFIVTLNICVYIFRRVCKKQSSWSPEWHSHSEHSWQNQLVFIRLCFVCLHCNCLSSSEQDRRHHWSSQGSIEEEGSGWMRKKCVHVCGDYNSHRSTQMPTGAENLWWSSWNLCWCGSSLGWRHWWWLRQVRNKRYTCRIFGS